MHRGEQPQRAKRVSWSCCLVGTRYAKLSQDAMLIIVWLKVTGCLYHGYNLTSVSAYNIVEVIHARSYLVFVDAVSDE